MAQGGGDCPLEVRAWHGLDCSFVEIVCVPASLQPLLQPRLPRPASSLCSSPACPGSLPGQCSTQIGCHAPCQQARTCNNILVTLNMTACRLGCLICVRRERVPLGMVMTAAKASPAPRDFIGAIQAAAERTAKPGLIAEVGRQ